MHPQTIDNIFNELSTSRTTISQFLLYILTDDSYRSHDIVLDLIVHAQQLCNTLSNTAHYDLNISRLEWHVTASTHIYREELKALIRDEPEWKFSAARASLEQIEEFRIEVMAQIMEERAPQLWSLLGSLLTSDNHLEARPDAADLDDMDESWDLFGTADLEGIIKTITGNVAEIQNLKVTRKNAIVRIKKVVLLSILMQSSNQKTNAMASMIGIFLHSCRTPERVIEALARTGISISVNAIHQAITSLSAQSAQTLQNLGQSLLVAYAYDNFDVDLKASVPTLEKSNTSLKHLTSAIIFPLQHGIRQQDLKCSQELWEKSRINPNLSPSDLPPIRTWKDLLQLHAEKDLNPGDLCIRDRFNAWKFLQDLCFHGPSYFSQFQPLVGNPDTIESIPLVKTPTYPARAMEFSNSTVSGNISTLLNLAEQGGIGDPNDDETQFVVKDAMDYVIMFHGDLGTGDRIFAILLRRSIEKTPWKRFQFIIFVPGLFHVKMACADGMWRIFIHPPNARQDETSVMFDIAKLRPKETGVITSSPGFRRMHQVIGHTGICRRLDCWRVEVAHRDSCHATLDDFAASRPSFNDLKELSQHLARQYVAGPRLNRLRLQPEAHRDKQYENTLLYNKYSLLYEELSHGMNVGDIGRVEACLVPWIFIFRATGKHKYAMHMTRFLTDVHFLYPDGLRRAVRYNILINPTGKEGHWRAIDWCVELNNLYTKVEHGGSSSNRTVERIIKESPLVQAYRKIKSSIEKNFVLTHLTSAHADPDMRKTFVDLQKHLSTSNVHKITPGRGSKYIIPDMIDKGRMALQVGNMADITEDNDRPSIDIDDILVELVD